MSAQEATSNLSDSRSILERLEKVEKQNRTLKRSGLAILALIAAIAAMGQAQRVRTVEAERFILRDQAGRTRGEITVQNSGEPSLEFFGKGGERQASLHEGDLMFFSQGEMTRVTAGELTISQGEFRIELGLGGPGEGRLKISFAKGYGYVSLGMVPALSHQGVVGPALVLSGNEGRGFAELDTADGPRLHMEPGLWGGKVPPGGFVDINSEGPLIQIADQQGLTAGIGRFELKDKQLGKVVRTPTASIVLAGKDKVLWTAP